MENQDGNDEGTNWSSHQIDKTTEIRKFNGSELFEWHRDSNNRKIEVVKIKGNWKFQYDDQMPFDIHFNSKFNVIAEEWHRLISMNDDNILWLKIKHL